MSKRKLFRVWLIFVPAIMTTQVSLGQGYDPEQIEPRASAVPGMLRALAGGANLLRNGSFEINGGAGTNLLTDWTVVNLPGSVSGLPGSGDWFVQTGTGLPLNGFPVDAPTDGAFAAMTDQRESGSHILYQDFAVPSNGGSLSCDIYIGNRAGVFINDGNLDFEAGSNQYFRIDIMNPAAPVDDVGAGVLQNIYITNPGDPAVQSYRTIVANLTSFGGQTVRLRFAEVDNLSIFNTGVDNCVAAGRANPAAIPAAGTGSLIALSLLLLALGLVRVRRTVRPRR